MARKEFTINSQQMDANSFSNWNNTTANNNQEMNQFESPLINNGLSLSLGSTQQNSNQFFADSLSSIFRNSPYLKPAQELLNEVVCVSNVADEVNFNGRFVQLGEREISNGSSGERECLQSKLIALLNELENRYENYFNQMEQVIASFEAVLGTGAASSYTSLTIQAMLRHFTNLRDAIVAQIHASKEPNRLEEENVMQNKESNREILRNLGRVQMRQVWRPLRGLPEDSVSVLRSWLFEHFLHPYPNDNEKLILALRTGLSRNQISNWFINARVRLWKPMIEEMYKEEFSDDSKDLSANSS